MKNILLKIITDIKNNDKKVVTIFISLAILQTISFYFCSRKFFHSNFNEYFFDRGYNPEILEYFYWFISDTVIILIIPILIIKTYFKEALGNYGFSISRDKVWWIFTLFSVGIMFLLIWFATSSTSFANQYPSFKPGINNWNLFFLYEATLLVYMVGWEFLFRGYTLFGLKQKFGIYAILMQMLPFVILHNGKPVIETFAAIGGGLLLGIMAYYSKSIIYGIVIHFSTMFIIDLVSALRIKADDFGVGIISLIKVFGKLF